MSPLLAAQMRRNAERARAVGFSQCFIASLLVAAWRRPARDVVPQVIVAIDYFRAAVELEGGKPCPA